MSVGMERYPCVYMRGGTSKAVIFHKKDLPEDRTLWADIFLKVMGTPDPKQIDGMGGTVSSTSKIAVIAPSQRADADVDYYFVQVDIKQPNVSDNLNCGNISSAVGPFAIDEGLVPAVEPVTTVRIYNENTKKIIESHVRVSNGKAEVYGDTEIDGVPGTGSPIDLYFDHPGGAATGKTFPTGKRMEILDIPGYGPIAATIADISNAAVFVRAADVGMSGVELMELNENKEIMEHLERIRCIAAEKLGFVEHWEDARTKCTASPKIGILSAPQDYTGIGGKKINAQDMDICCRMISLGVMHKAYPMTYAIGTGVAAMLEGTIASEMAHLTHGSDQVVIGHASGCTVVKVCMNGDEVEKAGIIRTARRIMDGHVYIRR